MVHSPWLHAPMRALVHFASPLILCAGMLACGHDRIAAPAPGHIEIAGGNAQHGGPGQPLALPIAVVVGDGSGDAVSDVHVSWRADDGGTIAPGESITDATGRRTAPWS